MSADREQFPLPFVEILLKSLRFEFRQASESHRIYFRKDDNVVIVLECNDNLNVGDIHEIASVAKVPPQPLLEQLRIMNFMFEKWREK